MRTLISGALVLVVTLLAIAPGIKSAQAANPYLSVVEEYSYLPLLYSHPHGKLNVVIPVSKLKDDGNSSYDWYFYEVRQETVPGTVAYSSDWKNDYIWSYNEITFNQGVYRWIDNYDPTTTSGQSSVTVGLEAGSTPSFGVSWSYTVSDVAVLNQSDLSEYRAAWEHSIDQTAYVGSNTYMVKPGFVERVNQGYASLMDAWLQVRFVRQACCWWWDTETIGPSSNLNLDAYTAG